MPQLNHALSHAHISRFISHYRRLTSSTAVVDRLNSRIFISLISVFVMICLSDTVTMSFDVSVLFDVLFDFGSLINFDFFPLLRF